MLDKLTRSWINESNKIQGKYSQLQFLMLLSSSLLFALLGIERCFSIESRVSIMAVDEWVYKGESEG